MKYTEKEPWSGQDSNKGPSVPCQWCGHCWNMHWKYIKNIICFKWTRES